jgi:hypothetical protein
MIFTKTDFKEQSRLTIGFDLKEFKNLIEYLFSNFNEEFLVVNKHKIIFNVNNNKNINTLFFDFEVNDYFKEKINQFKKSKIKKILFLLFIKKNS